MLLNKLKSALAIGVVFGLLATGTTLLAYRPAVGQDEKTTSREKTVESAAKQEPPMEEAKPDTRVFTPEELIRDANSLKPDEKVLVQFKVRLAQPSPPVAGHGADDLSLYPYDQLDWTQKQFAAVLSAKAKQQLKRLGIEDAGKHFTGKTIYVTGRVSSYLPITDDPVSERQYELRVDDMSQIEVKADPPAKKEKE